MTMNEFELERARRIESNRKRMAEMGLVAMSTDLARCATPVKRPTVRARAMRLENSAMRAVATKNGRDATREARDATTDETNARSMTVAVRSTARRRRENHR